MNWAVLLSPKAEKELLAVHAPDRDRIRSRFVLLEFEARPFGAIPLKGSPFYRLRVGDWRIIYVIDDERRFVTISRVLRRSEKTYRGL